MVRRSSSACEGCSCMPSPALRTGRPVAARQQVGRAGRWVAQDDALRAERAQGEAGVLQGLALFDGGGLRLTSVVSAPRLFGGEFEGGAGAGAGLVEEQRDAALGEARSRGSAGLAIRAGWPCAGCEFRSSIPRSATEMSESGWRWGRTGGAEGSAAGGAGVAGRAMVLDFDMQCVGGVCRGQSAVERTGLKIQVRDAQLERDLQCTKRYGEERLRFTRGRRAAACTESRREHVPGGPSLQRAQSVRSTSSTCSSVSISFSLTSMISRSESARRGRRSWLRWAARGGRDR